MRLTRDILKVPDQMRLALEERLKNLMQELGTAINESLAESERIADAVSEIRKNGYDVFLVLEATIGLNRRDESELDDDDAAPAIVTETSINGVKFTPQDQKFLRALKIAIDEDDH